MNSRVDRQTDQIVPNLIQGLRTDLDTLKASNQSLGPDSVTIQRTATHDSTTIIESLAAYAVTKYVYTFFPSKMQNPYADATISIGLTNPDGSETTYLWPSPSRSAPNQLVWAFTFVNGGNAQTLTAVVVFKSPDTGTIGVVHV